MSILTQIISGWPGLFYALMLWMVFHNVCIINHKYLWPAFYYLFPRQRKSKYFKLFPIIQKEQVLNIPSGSRLSTLIPSSGILPENKSNRSEFYALFSESAKKLGLLFGIFMILSFTFTCNVQAATRTASVSGNWNNIATWGGPPAAVPVAGDDVVINGGVTVTIDTDVPALSSLAVSGTLQYEATTARTLNVNGIVTVNSGGAFLSAPSPSTSVITTHSLVVSGSIINNGTINFSATAGAGGSTPNASGVGITFTGASNAIFDCSSATLTNLRHNNGIVLNKGTSASSVLTFSPGGTFQVESGNTDGFLTINNGTFKIIGTNAFSNPVFELLSYVIPGSGGFELSNPNAVVVGQNGSVDNNGILRISAGIYNIGSSLGNSSVTNNGGTFELSGGEMNVAGRFLLSNAQGLITGGSLNLSTIGHASATQATFQCSLTSDLTISGGATVTFVKPNTNATPFNDIEILDGSGSKSIAGGTFILGNASTPAGSIFRINSDIPLNNLTIGTNAVAILSDDLTVNQNLLVNGELQVNSNDLVLRKFLPDVVVNFTGGIFNAGATINVTPTNGKHPQNKNTTNYLNHYWTITTSNITNPVVDVTLTYSEADVVGSDSKIITGVYKPDSKWYKYSPAATALNNLLASGINNTSFSITGITSDPPTVTVTASPATICAGSSSNLTATPVGDSPFSYLWNPVTGLSSSTIANPVATPATTTSYTLTVTDGNGFTVNASQTITVNALPIATATPASQTICSGTAPSIALTSNIAGTTFSWTVVQSGVSGASGGSGTTIDQTLTTTGTIAGTATYTITPTANGCAGSPLVVVITVNPKPVATASPMTQIICSSGTTGISLTSSLTGTTYSWTVVQSGVSGASNGTGNTISQVLTTTGSGAGTATYTITPTANGCSGNAITAIVTVNPLPVATATPSTQTICSASATNIVLSSNIPGTTYSWTVTQSGVSGATAGSGPVIAQTLTATGAIAGTATYQITPTANGCPGNPITVVITVSPPPTITLGTVPATCPGAVSFSLPYTATSGNPTTYSISSGTPALSGFVPVVNASLTGSPLVISLPSSVPGGTYQFIISVKDASGCVSLNQTFNVDFVDIVPPVISGCPANITINTGPGSTTCDKTATWTEPTATDNCIPASGLSWTKNYLPGAVFPVGTTTVTYTVKDLANNTSTCTFTVTVVDNTPPTFTTPAAITIYSNASCTVSALPALTGNVTIKADNCTPVANLTVGYTDGANVPGSCTGTYSFTRTWTVSDQNGNSTTGTQLITVADNIKPTLNLPLPVTIECTASTLPANTGQPTGSDNCGGPVTFTYTDVTVPGNCAGRSTITRTWTATDCSGNSTSGTQTINREDTQAPILVCTNFSVANPNAIPPSDAYSNLAAVDNCGGPVEFVLTDESYTGLSSGAGFCPTSVIRKYVARDQCGNTSAECTQTITVTSISGCAVCQSTVPFYPAILDGAPDSLWISPSHRRQGICCGATGPPPPRCTSFNVYLDKDAVGLIFDIESGAIPPGALYYQVDCGPPTPVGEVICLAGGRFYTVTFCKPGNNENTYSIQSISGITGAGGIITRQDAQCADTLTVSGVDPTSVHWTVKSPNDQTLLRYLSCTDCMAPIFTPDKFTPPTIVYEVCGTILGTAECNGNPMTDCNDVTVTTLPAIVIAFDVNLGNICANNIPTINATVTPTNNTYTYQWFSGSDGSGSLLSTNPSWKPTAEGVYSLIVTETTSGIECNSATYNFTIAFDVLGPTSIVAPPPLVVECNGPGVSQQIINWLATASAFDGTESIPVSNNYTGITMACGQPPLTVTFSASDQCGNISTATSTITVVDTQAPTWTTATGTLDRTVSCSDAAGLTAAQLLAPVASDLCDPSLVLTKVSGVFVPGLCQGSGTYTNTWTARDDCNNVSAIFTQTITITDTEAPVITTQAQNQTVECDGSGNTAALNNWLANHGGAVATDACGGTIVWTNDNTPFSDLCGNTGVKTVIFTATDACGNSSTTTATFTITDTTAPTLENVPADVSFECTDCIQSFLNGGFEENTEVNNWAYVNETSVNGWETTSSTNRIEIQESGKVDGVVSYKGKYHAELNGDQVGDFYQQFCTIPTTYVQISFAHRKRTSPINTTNDIMGVYAGPSLSSLSLLGTFTATNSSGWRLHTVAFPVPAGQTSTVFLFRAIQGAPTDLTYGNLIDDIKVTTLTSPSAIPTATDNCGDAAISIDEQRIDGSCPSNYQLIRTYTATDECGNSTSASQTVTIGDFKAPVWTTAPGSLDRTISCSDAAALAQAQALSPLAKDSCDLTPSIVKSSGSFVPVSCLHSGTYTNTWIATDDCGNSSEVFTQVITVIDNEAPVITCPANTTGTTDTNECFSKTIVLGMATATDNCSSGAQLPITNDAPAQFPVGVTIVTWTATDACGNKATCTQTVTVTDNNQPPTITCPANVSETVAADQCTKTGVVVGVPAFADNCPNPVLTYTLAGATTGSGTGTVPANQVYGVGVTTVTYTVTDANNNTVSCDFTVTIERLDIPPAVINCPANPAAVTVAANACDAPVTVASPVEVDPCATATYTFVNDFNNTADASGVYPIGTTTVTWTITDNSGNVTTCTQTVVVNDLLPTITCPANVSETVAADQCTKTGVVVGVPAFADNCPNPVLTYTLAGATTGSGTGTVPANQVYGVGVTTVTYTVTDANNNTVSCDFTVTIERLDIPPAVINCPANPAAVTVAANACDAPVTVAPPVEVDPCATATYTFINDFNNTADASGVYPIGTTTVTWTITDNSGNITTCTQTVVVNDLPPTITCPASVSETVAADQCTKTGVVVGVPAFADNCPNPLLTYELAGATTGSGTGTVPANQVYGVGVTTVTYTVTDSKNNSANCNFTVTIERLDIPPAVINCPANPAAVTVAANACDAPVTVAPPVEVDPCATATYVFVNDFNNSADASDIYPIGTTTVTWTITDNSGNVTTCTQTVVVNDLPPTITCPANVSETVAADQCTKTGVVVGLPTFADNCPNPVLTYELTGATTGSGTGTVPANQVYGVGVTTVTYTVTDSKNHSANCNFTVTIERLDIPPAVINCPANPAAVTVAANACDAPVTVASPVEVDPCATATYTFINDFNNSADASDIYPIGTTTVTWTITDNSGNVTTCTQTVVVNDLLPTITCPADIVEQADFEQPYQDAVTVPGPTSYSDNCPNPVLTWTLTPPAAYVSQYAPGDLSGTGVYPSPNKFYVGVSTLTYTVTDSNNNTASCSFTVTVIGEPVITCPPPASYNTDPGVCTATRNSGDYGLPTLVSGVQPITWTWTITEPDGTTIGATGTFIGSSGTPGPPAIPDYAFKLGTSTILWRAENISGFDECTQLITVEDKELPTFTPVSITECVDMLRSAVYTATNPNPNSGVDPNLIKNPSPDYYTFTSGDISLDLTDSNLDDNCCDPASMTVNWRIEFADVPDPLNPTGPVLTHPDIIGTGQPSTYGSDILMWGDGVNYTTVTHSIFYWVEDCHGNTSAEQRGEINITPRPKIIKMN